MRSKSEIQNGSLTEKNFLVMLDIVFVTTAPIRVSAKDTGRLPRWLVLVLALMWESIWLAVKVS